MPGASVGAVTVGAEGAVILEKVEYLFVRMRTLLGPGIRVAGFEDTELIQKRGEEDIEGND